MPEARVAGSLLGSRPGLDSSALLILPPTGAAPVLSSRAQRWIFRSGPGRFSLVKQGVQPALAVRFRL
jgi:hypothetical protein